MALKYNELPGVAEEDRPYGRGVQALEAQRIGDQLVAPGGHAAEVEVLQIVRSSVEERSMGGEVLGVARVHRWAIHPQEPEPALLETRHARRRQGRPRVGKASLRDAGAGP